MDWNNLTTEQKEYFEALFNIIGITKEQGISEYNLRNS